MAVLVLGSWNLLRTHIQSKLHVASSVGSWFFIYSLCFFVSTKKGRSPLRPVDAGWAWREQTESTSGQRAPTPTTRAPVRGALIFSPKAASALEGHFSSSLFLSARSFFRVPRHVHQGWWGLSYGRRRSSARRRRSTEEFVFSRDHQRSIVRVPRPQAA